MKKKHVLLAVVLAFLALPFVSGAFSSEHPGCGGNCMDCHKLDKKEVEVILKKLNPGLSVVDIKQSAVRSLWQIEVDNGEGKRGPIFLDFSKKNLLVVNQIIPVDEIGKPAPQRKVDVSKIPLKDAVLLGSKKAKKKVAVFTDPDCPYCRQLHDIMKQIVSKRKDIAFYLVLNPLPMHKDAYKKAQAILCEKSIELADDAFSGKAVPEPKCGNEQVEKNIALAKELDFRGTPALVREDGLVLGGFLPEDKLLDWIDAKEAK